MTEFERWNLAKWKRNIRTPLVESFFFKINIPEEECVFFGKYTFLKPSPGKGESSGNLWGIFFDTADRSRNRAFKETFHEPDIVSASNRFYLKIGAGELAPGLAAGKAGEIEWNLTFETGGETLVHFPYEIMYSMPFPKNKIVSPLVSTKFYGDLKAGGRKIKINGSAGMQGHNWGSKHSSHWVWTHCNLFDKSGHGGVVFEGISSRLPVGNYRTPPLTIICLKRGKEVFLFNNPIQFLSALSRQKGLRWEFGAYGGSHKIEGVFFGESDDFIGLNYINPDGTITPCLNSMACGCSIRLFKKKGFSGSYELLDVFSTDTHAALEIGGKI
ncbi:MAG: hypothetical protein FJ088_14860, partial [Deltaproteobacteria bacterium]|nr:hypothetical protein [Deltaproteobacteria bacterium]